jgi:2-oxoisovalerate dehydrogenase E2 component (dihydrolipoyl transacylase)
MATLRMPQLGESVTEGTIAKWLKKPGEYVRRYDAVAEVITDKVNAEIPSDFEGVFSEALVEEGETVAVGTPIAVIAEAGADSTDRAAPNPAPPGRVETQKTRADIAPAARYSPAVSRLAAEHQIDLRLVKGTGAGGRITRNDVLAYIASQQSGPEGAAPFAEAPRPWTKSDEDERTVAAPVAPQSATGPVQTESPVPFAGFPEGDAQDTIVPVDPIRRTIAARMTESKREIPHAWMMVEADLTGLVRLRSRIKDEFLRQEGVVLTYLPFVVKAVADSLREFPALNAAWDGDRIILRKNIHLSIAVSAGDALIVPVIRHADRLSIRGLARAIHDLADRARRRALSLEEVQGGTFTVNNTGAFGSVLSTPIIPPGQVAILTLEQIVKRPVVTSEDAIAIRSIANLCLSLDHRVLDGWVCGQFLRTVRQRLEAYDTATRLD